MVSKKKMVCAWMAFWQLNNFWYFFFSFGVRISEVNYYAYKFYHFTTSINQPIKIDFFSLFSSYIFVLLTEQCTKWAYKIKPTQRDTVRFINRVLFFFFSYNHLEWSSWWRKKSFFFIWRKKKNFLRFSLVTSCYAKRKKPRNIVWDYYIWLCFVFFVNIKHLT